MPQASVYVKGIDQLERECNKLLKAVGESKEVLLKAGADKIKGRIKEKAPLGPTGNLKKAAYSIAYPETVSVPAHAYAGIRQGRAPHAHLVEYGHAGPHPAPPHPFFRPAIDEVLPEVLKDIEGGLKDIIAGSTTNSSQSSSFGAQYEKAHGR